MKRLAVLILGTLSAFALAADDLSVTFSRYDHAFRFVGFEAEHGTYRFRGAFELTGTLVADFDASAPDRASGDINFLTFVPDAQFLPRMPAVIKGFYAAPVRELDVEPQDLAYTAAFGKAEGERLSHGTSLTASKRITLTIRDYATFVECDSRRYSVTVAAADIAALEPGRTGGPEAGGC